MYLYVCIKAELIEIYVWNYICLISVCLPLKTMHFNACELIFYLIKQLYFNKIEENLGYFAKFLQFWSKNIKISTLKLKKNSFTIIIFYKKFDLFGYISYIFFPLYMLYMVIVRSATKSGKTGGSQKCVFCLSDWYLNNFFLCMPSERVTLTWKVFFSFLLSFVLNIKTFWTSIIKNEGKNDKKINNFNKG